MPADDGGGPLRGVSVTGAAAGPARALALPCGSLAIARASVILGGYALAIGAVLALPSTAAWWAGASLAPAAGFVLAGFFNAAHDCVHRTHVCGARGNRIAGVLWSVPVLSNFSLYRRSHLIHHRRTGIAGDTETPHQFAGVADYLRSVSGIGYWRFALGTIARCWRGSFPTHVTSRADRRAANVDNAVLTVWLAVMLAATLAFPRALAIAYWLPLAWSAPWMILLAIPEHHGLHGAAARASNTRSVTSNAVLRFVQWNANFHADHHRFPGVPAVHLARLRRVTGTAPGAHVVPSYTGFHARLIATLLRGDRSGPAARLGDWPKGNSA